MPFPDRRRSRWQRSHSLRESLSENENVAGAASQSVRADTFKVDPNGANFSRRGADREPTGISPRIIRRQRCPARPQSADRAGKQEPETPRKRKAGFGPGSSRRSFLRCSRSEIRCAFERRRPHAHRWEAIERRLQHDLARERRPIRRRRVVASGRRSQSGAPQNNFGGGIEHEWAPGGLITRLTVPILNLAR
jgi:hypothetical protein